MALTEQTRYRLMAQINSAFTPNAPIDNRSLFAGRKKQVEKLISAIFQKGSHAVLFGERGVGKSSLARTIFDFLVLAFDDASGYHHALLNSAEAMSFEDIWRAIFKQLTFEQPDGETTTLDQALAENPNSESVREVFQLINDPTIIIIDEFDRIEDSRIRVKMADTIKTLSDNAIRTTLVLVGVADSVDELIGEHQSIERAIKQVPMPRMSKGELVEIVDNGMANCLGLSIQSEARERMADLAQGLPSYTHLLARESALNAVRNDQVHVTMQDLEAGIRESVDGQLGTTLTLYTKATTAARGIYFKPVLLACALAAKDEKGFFYAKDIVMPLKSIIPNAPGIQQFAQHLKDFCESRGPVLERDGRRYRFIKPLMGPYVILRGLADGLIKESQLSHPSTSSTEPEQLSLLGNAIVPPLVLEP
jgi:Cdc6-like AAA superfamily ATPase